MRADRQPEFTQVDMELSFVDQEDILRHLERMFRHLFREAMGIELPPLPRLTWREAMDRLRLRQARSALRAADRRRDRACARLRLSVFRKAVEAGGVVRALNVKGRCDFPAARLKAHQGLAYGAGGWRGSPSGRTESPTPS
ncbi:MAG: amino acid--tRNA ligase-related protein [Anaerotruncus massiliensis (ex Togo et al. 2019)]